MHSRRYITLFVEQFVWAGVGWLLLFVDDVILIFLDMVGQHLQFWVLHPAEWPSRLGVVEIVMGSFEVGGCSMLGSLALVRVFARFLFLLRTRCGVGTLFSSHGVGLRICLMFDGLI